MTIHERTHTGAKPYPCNECDTAFNINDDTKKPQECPQGKILRALLKVKAGTRVVLRKARELLNPNLLGYQGNFSQHETREALKKFRLPGPMPPRPTQHNDEDPNPES